MSNAMNFRRGRSCVFLLHAHLVFVTKYRRRIWEKDHLNSLKSIFEKVCQDFGASLVECEGEADHVHLLINYPPKVALSKLVNSLKGVSSRLLKKMHPELKEYYWGNMLWSPSYFAASCGGAPLDILRQYIEQQETPK